MEIHISRVIFIAAFVLSTPALAFKPEGHRVLEERAYAELRNAQQPIMVLGEPFIGRNVIDGLMNAGALQKGPDGGPLARSDVPDVSVERQVHGRNQGFHFMATNDDVYEAAKEPDPKHALLERALPRNLKLMRLLFDETIINPGGAFQAGRGMYVLLHVVADGFSREHINRNDENRLVTIKGWQLLSFSWPEKATAQDGEDSHGRPLLALLHHSLEDGADVDWRDSTNASLEDNQPRLRPEGQKALEAMKSLLVVAYAARDADDARRNALWAYFVEEHFNNELCPLISGRWREQCGSSVAAISLNERMRLIDADAIPSWHIGLGGGARWSDAPLAAFADVSARWYAVPWAATGLLSRLCWGVAGSLRPNLRAMTLSEGSVQLTVASQIPSLRWLDVWLDIDFGGALRGRNGFEGGPVASGGLSFYLRRYFALQVRYEHDWWLTRGAGGLEFNVPTDTLSVGVMFHLVHAREVYGVTY